MHRRWLVLTVVLLSLISVPVWAQNDAPTSGNTPPAAGTSDSTGAAVEIASDDAASEQAAAAAAAADPLAVRQLGGASMLSGHSVWHAGPLYLYSGSVQQGYYSNDISSAWNSIVSADLGIDKRLGRNRFSLQYSPRFYVMNGDIQNNLADVNTSLTNGYRLSSRATLNFGGTFNTQSNKYLDPMSYLSIDPTTGSTYANQFGLGNSRTYNVGGSASLSYQMNARSSVSIQEQVSENWIDGNSSSASNPAAMSFTSGVDYRYSINSKRSIGAGYTYQFGGLNTGFSDLRYSTMSLFYSDMIGKSLHVSASAGATSSSEFGRTDWGGSGSLSLVRGFRRSSIGLALSRTIGLGVSQFVNIGPQDRADITYSRMLGRAMGLGIGGGFFRGMSPYSYSQIQNQRMWGKYVNASFSVPMRRNLNWNFSYSRVMQSGDATQYIPGNYSQISFGITWVPNPVRGN